MKFRLSFVTNSSSSSFICDVCGRTESGWDLGLSECDMCECTNGHVFCVDEQMERPSKEEMIRSILENEWNEVYDRKVDDYVKVPESELCEYDEDELFHKFYTESGHYQLPEQMCPICQFIEYSQDDLSKYLEKVYGTSRDIVFAEVKALNKRRKKLYEEEYITYVCKQYNLNPTEIVASWKNQFGTYTKFYNYLYS